MKGFKKLTAIILCAILTFTAISMAAFATEERNVVDSGFCGAEGENLTWTFYDDGELVISGEGEMALYYVTEKGLANSSPLVPPWYGIIDEVKVITVEEGVTGIGYDAFECETRMYYRVNLPQSLEYYYFGSFSGTVEIGKMLACCYSGTQKDWGKVQKRSSCSIRVNEEHTEIIRFEHKLISYGSGITDNAHDDMYYNGEEPVPYCKIYFKTTSGLKTYLEKDEKAELYVQYYSGKNTNAKLVWRTEGDACKLDFVKHTASGIPVEADVTSVTHGDYSAIIELVNPDETVICSDRKDFTSYVPEDMTPEEKREEMLKDIEEQFHMAGFTVFFTTFFILVPIVFGPIITPISLLINAVYELFNK